MHLCRPYHAPKAEGGWFWVRNIVFYAVGTWEVVLRQFRHPPLKAPWHAPLHIKYIEDRDALRECFVAEVALTFCIYVFFFKQKTAYEIMPSLVGSEMCIRDRWYSMFWGYLLLPMAVRSVTSHAIAGFQQKNANKKLNLNPDHIAILRL